MKRARILIGITAALIAVSILPSGAIAYGDVKGPPCADMTAGDAAAEGYTTAGTLIVRQQLSKPACDSMTYILHVLDASGATEIATDIGTPGTFTLVDDTVVPVVNFEIDPVPGTPAVVCFFMTVDKASKLLDRAPDIDDPNGPCATIALGTSNAGRKYG